MASIKLVRFGGVVPRYNATLLRENMASEAENVRLWHGTLAPFRMPEPVFEAPASCVRTIHRFKCCWLTWESACVDVAEWLPTCERVYVTGAAPHPQVGEILGDDCAVTWRRVGLPLPVDPPSATPLDASLPERVTSARSYIYTYVNSFGEEGAPSPPSDELLDMQEGAVARVSISAPPAGWDIAGIRLYRVGEGFNDGTKPGAATSTAYFFVADLPPVAQTFDDGLMSDELAEANVSEQYTPPPDRLEGIVQLQDGVLAGFVGNQVWFSEPYEPQAWPVDYMLALDDNVRALRWRDGVLYAMTDGHPYAIAEECPDGQCCRKVYRFAKASPIVSRKSAAVAPHGVVYASDIGLTLLAGQRITALTAPWYARDDWQALLPHTMIGAIVDGQYIGVTCKAGFLFDFRDGTENDGSNDNDLMPITLSPNALHTACDGHLFLAFGNMVHEWDAGAEFLPYRWRSKLTVTPGQTNFAAAKAVLDGYPWPRRAPFGVRFKFTTDGRTALDRSLNHSNPFRLPSCRRNLDFDVEISGVETVREIHIATSMTELST